jgi:putative flippase GtrA
LQHAFGALVSNMSVTGKEVRDVTALVGVAQKRSTSVPASPASRAFPCPNGAEAAARWSLARLGRNRLLRFVLSGLIGNGTYAVLVLLLEATAWHMVAIHLLATAIATIVTNELHRIFTFRGSPRASVVRSQCAGGAMSMVGLVLSSLVVAAWESHAPHATPLTTILLVWAVTGLVGLTNFAVLRVGLGASRSPMASDRRQEGPRSE